MTDVPSQRVSLRDALVDIADDVRPVDLSAQVARQARLLRRRRTALGGAAAVGIIGASSVIAADLTASHETGQSVGGAPEAGAVPRTKGFGWFAYTPLRSAAASAAALTTVPVLPPPKASAGPGNTCYTFNNFHDPSVTAEEKSRASAMGTYLCAALGGGAKFGQMEEWVSTGGLSGGYPGRVYNIQAHHPELGAGNPTEQGEIWISVHKAAPSSVATHVTVSQVDGSLAAVWPDGTTVNLEAGKDTPANRAIIANPVFDAFRS